MFDTAYIIILILFFVASAASMSVKTTFNKYHRVRSARGMTGAEAAEYMLRTNGVNDVRIERIGGYLSDHYDPRNKVIRLSDPVYNNASVASVSVACHEAGHALQHAQGYVPLNIRTAILPVAQIGSQALWPLVMLGLFIGPIFLEIGIIFYSFSVIFQLLTLPVEFDASSRALRMMNEYGVLHDDENIHAKKVLNAAAMTYVAAAAIALGQLARLILMSNRRR